jgi:hypothetical protein
LLLLVVVVVSLILAGWFLFPADWFHPKVSEEKRQRPPS